MCICCITWKVTKNVFCHTTDTVYPTRIYLWDFFCMIELYRKGGVVSMKQILFEGKAGAA